jgi:hypothetical protein
VSSAILYVAIVAIWACVLIPRWLRRDQNQNHHHSERPEQPLPAPAFAESDEEADLEETPEPEVRPSEPRESAPAESAPREPISREAVSPGQGRHRMMAARRRLLIMLAGLEIAAGTLTAMNLAALWVVIPPTVMLAGYLLLLREAAQADRERAERAAEAARARTAARARAKEKDRRTAPPPPATAPPPPPAPEPGDFEDLGTGRDFAPGLAGKYTTSEAEVIDFNGYKRAVGD